MGGEQPAKPSERKDSFKTYAYPTLALTLIGIVGQAIAKDQGYVLPFTPFEGAVASFVASASLMTIAKVMTARMGAALAMVPPLFGGVFEFTRTGSAEQAMYGAGYGLIASVAGTLAYQIAKRATSDETKESK